MCTITGRQIHNNLTHVTNHTKPRFDDVRATGVMADTILQTIDFKSSAVGEGRDTWGDGAWYYDGRRVGWTNKQGCKWR